jgi:hypothetical protein
MSGSAARVVLLPPGLRFYSVVCKRCLREASPRHGYFGPILEGELPEAVPHLTTRCPRGHPITPVARVNNPPGRGGASDRERTMNYSAARDGRGK